MSNGFQFIDIIFFALIAAFLILRLRNVLGRRDGHEGGFRDPFSRNQSQDNKPEAANESAQDNVIPLPDQHQQDDDFAPETVAEAPPVDESDPLAVGLSQIMQADPSFSSNDFLSGARIAFEIILGSFAAGDTKSLKPLLSAEVFGNFAKSIQSREVAGETMDETLVGIKKAELMEAFTEGSTAHITVKFVSEQINAVRDENGDVVDGDPNTIITVTDFWTFARDVRARDPNWMLAATRSLD